MISMGGRILPVPHTLDLNEIHIRLGQHPGSAPTRTTRMGTRRLKRIPHLARRTIAWTVGGLEHLGLEAGSMGRLWAFALS